MTPESQHQARIAIRESFDSFSTIHGDWHSDLVETLTQLCGIIVGLSINRPDFGDIQTTMWRCALTHLHAIAASKENSKEFYVAASKQMENVMKRLIEMSKS